MLDGPEQSCSCLPAEGTRLSWPLLVPLHLAIIGHFTQVTFSCPQSLKGVNGRDWDENHLGFRLSPVPT